MLKINYNITYKTTTVKVNSKMIPDFMNPVTFWSGHLLNDIFKMYCNLSLIYCSSLTKIYRVCNKKGWDPKSMSRNTLELFHQFCATTQIDPEGPLTTRDNFSGWTRNCSIKTRWKNFDREQHMQ